MILLAWSAGKIVSQKEIEKIIHCFLSQAEISLDRDCYSDTMDF